VFLRALEYYAGTLFLTTNRVGTFDEAFRSRINLSIHYQTLNKKARKEIWANMIKLSDRRWARQNINDILDELDDLAKYELNGRQIRNALQTSSRIAEAENRQIHYKDLVQAITQTNSFEGYLRQVGPRHDRWVSASDEGIR
jgi:AAA+ superfamily predicted ATPase